MGASAPLCGAPPGGWEVIDLDSDQGTPPPASTTRPPFGTVPVATPGGRTSRPAAAFTAPSWSAQEAEADGRLDFEDVAEPKMSASTSFSINRGNGFEAFGHLDQDFYARNLGSTPVPPKNSYIADEPCVAVWYEHGVSSSSELKALNLELSSGSLFMPFDGALKLSRDPVAYPRARRALCEKLVGLVSSRLNVISTWRQLVSALRNFLSKRSDADSTYYFLSTFLAGEERTEDRAPRRSAFSEFMRALDAHFAPASTSEPQPPPWGWGRGCHLDPLPPALPAALHAFKSRPLPQAAPPWPLATLTTRQPK
eukprot:scaffold7306_cov124-Isochrysis_galbana.AAC.6